MPTTKLLLATATAALAVGGVATAASAPTITAQHTLSVRTAPVTIPGTGVHKGDRLSRGARIVYRDVTLSGSQQPRTTLTAPRGKTLRGLAPRESDEVGFAVVDKGSYVGHRRVRVRAYLDPRADEGTGRIYALVR
jgi:hypothetical protein